jgi:ATP-dependent Lon protease
MATVANPTQDDENMDSTFITSFKMNSQEESKIRSRRELLDSVKDGGEILNTHNKLQELADQLDDMVKKQLSEHEKDFFLAYKAHMYTVQRDFKQLKHKADEEETKTRRDAKGEGMALKAGPKGPWSDAQGCAGTTAHAADPARPTGGWLRSASAFLRR